jgi:hypothetical protein
MPHRPTHDADLLGFLLAEVPHLIAVFEQISGIECDDGIVFHPDTIRAAEIRKAANYAGIQVVHATFTRRGTTIPSATPLGLREEFSQDKIKAQQWEAFLRKNRLADVSLEEVVASIRPMLLDSIGKIASGSWSAAQPPIG